MSKIYEWAKMTASVEGPLILIGKQVVDEIESLRAALSEKEKRWAKYHDEIVDALDKEKSAAEREAQGLREERDAFFSSQPARDEAKFGQMKAEIDRLVRHASDCLSGWEVARDTIAAQAQEIKTLREDGDHEEALAIEGALRHIALFGKYGEAQDQLAAKDRLIAEQAAVIERAREALAGTIRKEWDDASGIEWWTCCGVEVKGEHVCDVTKALPAPQPAQEKPAPCYGCEQGRCQIDNCGCDCHAGGIEP